MRIRYGLIFLILMFMLAGCRSLSSPFTDDFSDPSSGWTGASYETYERGYVQGQYLIRIDVPQWFVWTTPGEYFEDVSIEVTARSEGSTDNHYGVLCRYDQGNFYYFAISADGYYGIFRGAEGQPLAPLTGSAMRRSPLIYTDGATNRLLVTCEGPLLTFYVNGEQLAQVTDEALTRGDMGLATGTVSRGGTAVWFDDLVVDKP